MNWDNENLSRDDFDRNNMESEDSRRREPSSAMLAEVDRLMAALDRGEILAEEAERLQQLVHQNAAARNRYVRGMMVKAALEWEGVGARLVAGAVESEGQVPSPASDKIESSLAPAAAIPIPPMDRPLAPGGSDAAQPPVLGMIGDAFRQGFAWGGRHAPFSLLVLAAIGLSALALYRNTASTPGDPSVVATTSSIGNVEDAEDAGSQFEAVNRGSAKHAVARLTNTWDALWGESSRGLANNMVLEHGQRLDLVGGLAEVTFECGAVVILQSPVSFVIESANGARLDSGRVTARVPGPSAKFWVMTPSMKVLDLGTEFGLSADAGGGAQVRVFEGAVEVEPTAAIDPAGRRLITAGQVGRVESAGNFTNRPSAIEPPGAYVRSMPNSFVEDYVRTILSSRPWGYWSFNSVITSTLVPDVSGHGRFGQLFGNAMVVQGGSILAIGQAAAIGGEGDSVLVPTGTTLSMNGDFTMEALFRTGLGGVLMSKTPADGSWQPGSKILYVRGGEVRFTPYVGRAKSTRHISAKVYVNDNQWHHVVLTNKANVKGSSDLTVLYVDGVERARRDSWDITSDDDSKMPIKLGLGSERYPTKNVLDHTEFPTRPHLTGHIDEAAVYDRCLSVDEIESHYRAYLTAGIARRAVSVQPTELGPAAQFSPEEE